MKKQHWIGRVGQNAAPGGTSLAVQQFLAIVRGEISIHEPQNPWKVVTVEAMERYCNTCASERTFDAVTVIHGETMFGALAVCRCCQSVIE